MPLVKNAKSPPTVRSCRRRRRIAGRRRDPGLGAALSRRYRRVAAAAGKTGVIWPNNRSVDDLVPYLDRLPPLRWCFRRSATAAPTARRGCCANATAMRASCAPPARCCATSSCSCARRLRRLRGEEGRRRGRVRRDHEALFGVLPADRRWPRHRAQSADAAASFGECRPVSTIAQHGLAAGRGDPAFRADARPRLARRLAGASH